MPENFTLHRPDPALAVPVIIHVPHAATWIPDHRLDDFALTGAGLQAVVDAMVDRDTDAIGLEALKFGAHVFVNNVCRLVMDPERFPRDEDECAATWGMGAIYTHAHDRQRLRRGCWTDDDRQARMDEYYFPYHKAMRELVEELQARFQRPVHVLDLHSFPDAPHPYETDRGSRPACCLGHEREHAPWRWLHWWEELADSFLASRPGLACEQLLAHNRPFAGSFIPQGLPWGGHGVRSMMLEINRELIVPWRESTLPAAVRAFAATNRWRDFFAFICGDAREPAPTDGRMSERAARAIVNDYLRFEHPKAVAQGNRIASMYWSDYHIRGRGAMFGPDDDDAGRVYEGAFWNALIGREQMGLCYDGGSWRIVVDADGGGSVVGGFAALVGDGPGATYWDRLEKLPPGAAARLIYC